MKIGGYTLTGKDYILVLLSALLLGGITISALIPQPQTARSGTQTISVEEKHLSTDVATTTNAVLDPLEAGKLVDMINGLLPVMLLLGVMTFFLRVAIKINQRE